MSLPVENNLRRLSPEELADPRLALENFFESFHLHETKQMLAQLQQQMNRALYNKGQRQQETWAFFFEKLEKLAEAGWVLRPAERQGVMD
jgi:hypothetical protein